MVSLMKVPRKGVSWGSVNIPLLFRVLFGEEKITQCIEFSFNGCGWVTH